MRPSPRWRAPLGPVAFDLDGTLLRGPTVCELLAAPLGRLTEMRRFEALSSEAEIAAARRGIDHLGFVVEWVAERLGVGRALGTRLEPEGRIDHVWPRDKARWLGRVLAELEVPRARAAAVGDSGSDADLLAATELRYFVGHRAPPALPGLVHRPAGDIERIAREILAHWPE